MCNPALRGSRRPFGSRLIRYRLVTPLRARMARRIRRNRLVEADIVVGVRYGRPTEPDYSMDIRFEVAARDKVCYLKHTRSDGAVARYQRN